MNRRHCLIFLSPLLLLFFAGCGGVSYTSIGEGSGGSGHKTDPMGNDQFEITYLGSREADQSSARMQDLTLLRAAEVALEYGYTHFVVEDAFESVQTKWKMKSSTSHIGSGGLGGGGLGTGGTTLGGGSGGVTLGGSSGGVGLGSSGGMGGMGGMGSGRGGMITTSSPVPVAIPELSIRIKGYHGVPSTAYQGELYDAARLRDILATQYGIKIEDRSKPVQRQQPVYQVIE